MAFFKSTKDVLLTPWEDEVFNPNWMDSNKIELPPKYDWDYSRELQIEDIDIWEVIVEHGGGFGIYAAWCPYAEFYMITFGNKPGTNDRIIETYYGKGADKQVQKVIKTYGIPHPINKIWVDSDKMWLYTD